MKKFKDVIKQASDVKKAAIERIRSEKDLTFHPGLGYMFRCDDETEMALTDLLVDNRLAVTPFPLKRGEEIIHILEVREKQGSIREIEAERAYEVIASPVKFPFISLEEVLKLKKLMDDEEGLYPTRQMFKNFLFDRRGVHVY